MAETETETEITIDMFRAACTKRLADRRDMLAELVAAAKNLDDIVDREAPPIDPATADETRPERATVLFTTEGKRTEELGNAMARFSGAMIGLMRLEKLMIIALTMGGDQDVEEITAGINKTLRLECEDAFDKDAGERS